MVQPKGRCCDWTGYLKWNSKAEEWGTGSFQCAVMALDEVQPKFVSVVIEQSTYENLMNQWRIVLEKSGPQNPPRWLCLFRKKQNVSICLHKPLYHKQAQMYLQPFNTRTPIYHRLQALLKYTTSQTPHRYFPIASKRLFHGRKQEQSPFVHDAQIFYWWCVEGDNVRPNPDLAYLDTMASNHDPIAQLLALVKPQEEAIAIRYLVCTPQARLCTCAHQWAFNPLKATLKKGNPDPTPQTDTSLRKIDKRPELRTSCSWYMVDRLFSPWYLHLSIKHLFCLVQQTTGTSTDGTGHQTVFFHADYEALRLSRRKSHLFGKFQENETSLLWAIGVKHSGKQPTHRNRTTDIWSPYFIMIETSATTAKRQTLQICQKSHSKMGSCCFRKKNSRWYEEIPSSMRETISTAKR